MPYMSSEEYSYETMRIAGIIWFYQPVLGITGMGSDSYIFLKTDLMLYFL